MLEQFGKRIARLRVQHGWTQQVLADRLAISRVAVSHLEMDLSVPSERTVTLLAGLFKLEPDQLVEGTTYPPAKAERLPPVACRYTEIELQLRLLRTDLTWLARLADYPQLCELRSEVRRQMRQKLKALSTLPQDAHETELIEQVRKALGDAGD